MKNLALYLLDGHGKSYFKQKLKVFGDAGGPASTGGDRLMMMIVLQVPGSGGSGPAHAAAPQCRCGRRRPGTRRGAGGVRSAAGAGGSADRGLHGAPRHHP